MSDTARADQALIRCEGLSVTRGKREVLRDMTLELHHGEIVALLGPNGAGKSTLLGALAGAIPATHGQIDRHGRIAIALQAPDLARRTVLDNVTLALGWWGVPRSERAGRAREALSEIRAEHLAERAAGSLSGGERRRVHLARTIAVRPDILMLDEPFAGLDAEVRATLLEDALSAVKSSAKTTLVVVHDRAEAWALADRLLILIDGELVAAGPPRQLLETPPTPDVARFLGFDGALHEAAEMLLTRPAHVTLDRAGPLRGRVTRLVPLEDGVRLELELELGRLYTVAPLPAPQVGDTVGVRVHGGVRFPQPAIPAAAPPHGTDAARRRESRGSPEGLGSLPP